jgi:hypothetical protein
LYPTIPFPSRVINEVSSKILDSGKSGIDNHDFPRLVRYVAVIMWHKVEVRFQAPAEGALSRLNWKFQVPY